MVKNEREFCLWFYGYLMGREEDPSLPEPMKLVLEKLLNKTKCGECGARPWLCVDDECECACHK